MKKPDKVALVDSTCRCFCEECDLQSGSVSLQVLEASVEQHVPVPGESEPKAIRMRFPFFMGSDSEKDFVEESGTGWYLCLLHCVPG